VATFYYTKTHEYIKDADGSFYLGITSHAAHELGDITYVELPAVGAQFAAGAECCTIESVKAVAPVIAPVTLKISGVNNRLEDSPELLNKDAQGEAWVATVELNRADLAGLMDQAAYDAFEK
jgi:glycine cleavage system H protein